MQEPDAWLEQWLSTRRLAPYLDAASGDREHALQLYLCSARLAGALLVDIGHLELAIRNAYDRALMRQFGDAPHWILRMDEILGASRADHPQSNAASRRVMRHAAKFVAEVSRVQAKSVDPAEVIASMSFGFWVAMTSAAQEQSLWVPAIRRAFEQPLPRVAVHRAVERARSLRNRIAHHDSLLRVDLQSVLWDIDWVFRALNLEAANEVQRVSQVPRCLAALGRFIG